MTTQMVPETSVYSPFDHLKRLLAHAFDRAATGIGWALYYKKEFTGIIKHEIR
jgi:hypothetical protein